MMLSLKERSSKKKGGEAGLERAQYFRMNSKRKMIFFSGNTFTCQTLSWGQVQHTRVTLFMTQSLTGLELQSDDSFTTADVTQDISSTFLGPSLLTTSQVEELFYPKSDSRRNTTMLLPTTHPPPKPKHPRYFWSLLRLVF